MAIEIFVKYHFTDQQIDKLVEYDNGDWIDLRAAEDVKLNAWESAKISLGVSIKVPNEYEIHLVPRSSTFDKYSIIQTNSMGVIDNSYCGNDDIIKMPVLAVRDTFIPKNTRIAQFRIVPRMRYMDPNSSEIKITEVTNMESTNRGGFGSSDNKF